MIEKKTLVGSLTVLGVAAAIAVLNALQDSPMLGGLPAWAQFLIVTLGPPLLTFLTQYQTAHTPRNDMDAQKEAEKAGLITVPLERWTKRASAGAQSYGSEGIITTNLPESPTTH